MSNTDRIGKLNLTFICKTCCNNIFCNITCSIRCGTVYLCTVFTGESTAAMTSGSTVSINDDLTSGKSAVTMRSADHETSCWVDEVFCVLIYHICRNDLIENIFLNVLMDLLLSYIRIMLCRAYYCIDTAWFSGFIIFYSNLCFSIRS